MSATVTTLRDRLLKDIAETHTHALANVLRPSLDAIIAAAKQEAAAAQADRLAALESAAFHLLRNLQEADVPGHGGEHVWYVVRLEDMDRLGRLAPTSDPLAAPPVAPAAAGRPTDD